MTNEEISCNDALISATRLFRLGMEGQAGENLVKFIDAFLPTLSGAEPEKLSRFSSILKEILAAQSRKDYLRVADLLEYEILPYTSMT